MNIKDRFQVVVSTQVDEHSQFTICGTCGVVVPRHPLLLAGYEMMDCQQIHHDWHEAQERRFNEIPLKN